MIRADGSGLMVREASRDASTVTVTVSEGLSKAWADNFGMHLHSKE